MQTGQETYRGCKHSCNDELVLQGGLDVMDAPSWLQVSGNQSGDQAHQDANSRNEQWVAHGNINMLSSQSGDGRDDQGSACGLSKGAEQVSTHASNVTNIVTNVVCSQQNGLSRTAANNTGCSRVSYTPAA